MHNLSACSALICEQAPIRRFSPLLRADRLAASAHQHTRYKTLPTRPKRPISASFAQAGRTLYRIHPHDPQQGELCTAPSAKPGTKLSQHTHTSSPTGTKLFQHTQNCPFQPVLPQQGELCAPPSAKPGTKLSQHAPASSPSGTKLSQHAQKGPFQPVLHKQGELCTASTPTTPSRENFVPRPVPNPVQNSPSAPVLQRFREKVRPAHPTPQQNREKVRPAHLKTAFFASFAPAGRIFSRSHPHQAEQGELIRAEDLTGRYDGATLKPPTPLFTVDRPRSSHRLYGRHPRPRTRALHNECHHNETRIRRQCHRV